MRSEIKVAKAATSHCREKLLARDGAPVPQTDTGSRGEYPQVSERTLVKELGKMAHGVLIQSCISIIVHKTFP